MEIQSTQPKVRRRSQRPDYIVEDPLLSAKEAAAESGRGVSTFWRDCRVGRLPPPIYISKKAPRWRRSELRAAIAEIANSTRVIRP